MILSSAILPLLKNSDIRYKKVFQIGFKTGKETCSLPLNVLSESRRVIKGFITLL